MPTFIKTGFWEKTAKGYNNWLNLDQLITNTNIPGSQGPQGIQGPVGPQGVPGPVGPAGLTWKSSWSSGTSYVADDAVGYGGASYFCILATSGITAPDVDTTHWALLASQGAIGPAGATGAQGPTGPQGPSGISGVNTIKVSLTSANILALNATPFVLIPAQGSGKLINVLKVWYKYNFVTSAYSGGGSITVNLGSVPINVTNSTTSVLSSGSSSIVRPTMSTSSINFGFGYDNVPIYLNASLAQTGGDSTLDVYLTYDVITL